MSDAVADAKVRLLFEPFEMQYDFGPYHPMHSQRLQALLELLAESDLWHAENELTRLHGRVATVEELQLIHTPDYIAAIQHLSAAGDQTTDKQEQLASLYGLEDGDTPAFPGMHTAAATIVGGTLAALSAVMGLQADKSDATATPPLHVFHPAGGWHHAWTDRASGFCIYNDIAVAIAHVLRTSEAKVAYIDFDAHHGDGVQRAFYDDPRVMTISLHETGRYLFPGTGDVLELGHGSGRGYSVNIPLEPFTEDDSYVEVMNIVLAPLLTSFAPDLLVTMHGCDVHAWDPLTHLKLSMHGICAQARLAHQLAHTYCAGRWVALGGGGYDLYRVVPRAWSLLWAEMAELPIPEQLPQTWVNHWEPIWQASREQEEQYLIEKEATQECFPTTFQDRQEDFPAQPRRASISHQNQETAALVRRLLLPSPIRQAFPMARRRSPFLDLFDLLHENSHTAPSRSKVLQTPRGSIILRDFCPPSLVERLHVENGLHAFARLPEREQQLLVSIARSPDCALTLAHTSDGEIIGQVTIAPLDDWWEGLENAYEVAIEVSANWRGLDIAKSLLAFALELDALEDMLLIALGLSWHWDLEGLGMSAYRYRQVISRLFASQGFTEHKTTEPNVAMEPENVLLVRIGKRVDPRSIGRFQHYIQR
jgi:acetoin utilization deacetylase AcuC-like enzyme/GNAT superfamily N-acetyltransferase